MWQMQQNTQTHNENSDDQGKRHYINNKTEESTWNAPEGLTGGRPSAENMYMK
jgi:hypothetical protein